MDDNYGRNPSQAEIEYEYYRQEAKRRKAQVKVWNDGMIEKLEALGISLRYELNTFQTAAGHGCACDSNGTCALHAMAYNNLTETIRGLELTVAALLKANQEINRGSNKGDILYSD